MTTINDILLAKGTHVHTIMESSAVSDAVKLMRKPRSGCLVMLREDEMEIGNVTESRPFQDSRSS